MHPFDCMEDPFMFFMEEDEHSHCSQQFMEKVTSRSGGLGTAETYHDKLVCHDNHDCMPCPFGEVTMTRAVGDGSAVAAYFVHKSYRREIVGTRPTLDQAAPLIDCPLY